MIMKTASTNSELVDPVPTAGHGSLLLALPALVLLSLCLAGCQETQPVYQSYAGAASVTAGPGAAPATPSPGAAPAAPSASPATVAPSPSAAPAGAEPFSSTKLQEGDVVHVTFETETNLNTAAKVQMDGAIIMPLVGSVKAVGKTPLELQADLMRCYERILKDNQLSVTLASSAASVYVSGAVLRPGRIPMERPLTALDAIMEAGGFDSNRAKPSAVTVLRLENGQQHHYLLNLKRALQGKEPNPFYLKPFDIVHVPEKTFNL
jgi:polysaccharide export outer membrane protein